MVDLHNAELSTITYCDAVAWIEASAVETQRGGFARLCVDVGGVAFDGVVGGSEPAVLLLHGFPQTHLAWRFVASRLAHTHTVVATDLPGYSRVRLLFEQPFRRCDGFPNMRFRDDGMRNRGCIMGAARRYAVLSKEYD